MTQSASSKRIAAAIAALGLALSSLLAVSTLGGAAVAAPPQATNPGPQTTSVLFLSVAPRGGPITTAILFCPPDGLHPYPVSACTDLSKAWGDFTKLPGLPESQRICPDVYDPVVASAFGWGWGNRLVWFQKTYGNMCELHAETGWVFPLPDTFPPPPAPQPTRPTSTPDPTLPGPTRPTVTVTYTIPTIPGPTVTVEPPETTFPHDHGG